MDKHGIMHEQKIIHQSSILLIQIDYIKENSSINLNRHRKMSLRLPPKE